MAQEEALRPEATRIFSTSLEAGAGLDALLDDQAIRDKAARRAHKARQHQTGSDFSAFVSSAVTTIHGESLELVRWAKRPARRGRQKVFRPFEIDLFAHFVSLCKYLKAEQEQFLSGTNELKRNYNLGLYLLRSWAFSFKYYIENNTDLSDTELEDITHSCSNLLDNIATIVAVSRTPIQIDAGDTPKYCIAYLKIMHANDFYESAKSSDEIVAGVSAVLNRLRVQGIDAADTEKLAFSETSNVKPPQADEKDRSAGAGGLALRGPAEDSLLDDKNPEITTRGTRRIRRAKRDAAEIEADPNETLSVKVRSSLKKRFKKHVERNPRLTATRAMEEALSDYLNKTGDPDPS